MEKFPQEKIQTKKQNKNILNYWIEQGWVRWRKVAKMNSKKRKEEKIRSWKVWRVETILIEKFCELCSGLTWKEIKGKKEMRNL